MTRPNDMDMLHLHYLQPISESFSLDFKCKSESKICDKKTTLIFMFKRLRSWSPGFRLLLFLLD